MEGGDLQYGDWLRANGGLHGMGTQGAPFRFSAMRGAPAKVALQSVPRNGNEGRKSARNINASVISGTSNTDAPVGGGENSNLNSVNSNAEVDNKEDQRVQGDMGDVTFCKLSTVNLDGDNGEIFSGIPCNIFGSDCVVAEKGGNVHVSTITPQPKRPATWKRLSLASKHNGSLTSSNEGVGFKRCFDPTGEEFNDNSMKHTRVAGASLDVFEFSSLTAAGTQPRRSQ